MSLNQKLKIIFLVRLKPWQPVLKIQGLFRITAATQDCLFTAIIIELETPHKDIIIEEVTEGYMVLIITGQ
jgi:hypothetical protein